MPLVIAQVDSFVGYLSDVFLSGYPLFPVVSHPNDRKEAEMLESIIDTHSMLGQYARHFLMGFRDGIKYNFMPIEHDFGPIEGYGLVTDYLRPTEAAKMQQTTQKITKIKRIDPYNTVFDKRVDPADVCYKGEYSGYVELVSRIPLKTFINSMSESGELYNIGKINEIKQTSALSDYYYTDLPQINTRMMPKKGLNTDNMDWGAWLEGLTTRQYRRTLQANVYERFTVYVRIIPSDFEMGVPSPNTPQIWKLILINGKHLMYAKRIYSVYDTLPMLIGQPIEDGFGLQTQSIGENQIDVQEAASTLLDIHFNSARRAVSDRAIYDVNMINESDVNTTLPAPKIPARVSGLNSKTIKDAYFQIPYDASGIGESMLHLRSLLDVSDKLSGLNNPFRGQFQKGNKSVKEWDDTMAFADNRPRLPALTIEMQIMLPIKFQMQLNIFQQGVHGNFQNFKTGEVYNIDAKALQDIQKKALSFRIADGYTPKSKLASTEFLTALLESLSQNQVLTQTLGSASPAIWMHLAQLGGVRGIEQYFPQQQQQSQQGANSGQPPAPNQT